MINARFGGWLGLAIGTVVAVWWLAAVRFALQNGFETTTPSVELLETLWLTRMLVMLLLAPVLGLRQPPSTACQPILCMAWMSLPLVVLGAAAAGATWQRVLLAELALLAAAGLAYAAGWALRHASALIPSQDSAGFALGASLAALAWANRAVLLPGWVA